MPYAAARPKTRADARPLACAPLLAAWKEHGVVLDPCRISPYIGLTGIGGDTFKRSYPMNRYGVQINKTSRNTVLFMTHIRPPAPAKVTCDAPGFPVLVPGQLFSDEILAYMRSLDTPEVHGLRPYLGNRVFADKALELAALELAALELAAPAPFQG